jgi:L-ascorbate metabolism protein UlaG (beta-lactamase superfamily)
MEKTGITIKWFPPSWLLIESANSVIYIDPAWIQKNFAHYPKKVIFSRYPQPMDGLPEPDLPKATIILITHHHQDHIKTATINRLADNKTVIYAPAKCARLIGRRFVEVKPQEEISQDPIKIRTVPAYNTSSGLSTRKVHHRGECVGYLVKIGGKTIYQAGDTDVIPEMNELSGVDVAFLPIGGTFTMNTDEAVKAVEMIKPKIAVPIHYMKVNPKDFEKKVNATSFSTAKIMQIGEIMYL